MALPTSEAILATMKGKVASKTMDLGEPVVPTPQDIHAELQSRAHLTSDVGLNPEEKPIDYSKIRMTQTMGDRSIADYPVPSDVKKGLARLQLYDTTGKYVPQVGFKPTSGIAKSTPVTTEEGSGKILPRMIGEEGDVYDKALGAITAPGPVVAAGLKRLGFDNDTIKSMGETPIEGMSEKLKQIMAQSVERTGKTGQMVGPSIALAGSMVADPLGLPEEGGKVAAKATARAIQLAQKGENAVPEILNILKKTGFSDDLAGQFAERFATADANSIEKGLTELSAAHATMIEKPKTPEAAAQKYWDEVVTPSVKEDKMTVLSGDEMKAHFGKDYAPERSDFYSKANYKNVERALEAAPIDRDFITLGGGPGSGKTELLLKNIEDSGFKGIVYDSTLSNYDGMAKLIEQARAQGRNVKVYGIIPDLDAARNFTKLRAADTGREVTGEAFARGHAGFPATVRKLLEDGVLKPDEVRLFDLRNIKTKEEVTKMVKMGITAQNPLDLLRRVNYTEGELLQRYAKTTTEHLTETRRVTPEAGSGRVGDRSFSADRADTGSRMAEDVSRGETRVGENPELKTIQDKVPLPKTLTERAHEEERLIADISREKNWDVIAQKLDERFTSLPRGIVDAFAKRMTTLSKTPDIEAMLSTMQRLENQAGPEGQRIMAQTPVSVRDVISKKEATSNIDLLTRDLGMTDAEGGKLLAVAENEYDELWRSIDQKAVDRFNEANIERSILEEVLSTHRAKGFTKLRKPGEAYTDVTLSERQASAMRRGTKDKNLDDVVSEAGYDDLHEAQKGFDDYLATRERLKEVEQEIKELRPKVKSSQLVRGILEGLPVITNKEAKGIDEFINSATVRDFTDISGFKGQFRDPDRNFERFFGRYYKYAKKIFLDPLDEGKRMFVDNKAAKREELAAKVTDKFKIQRGSEEAAAIQDWGERELMNDPKTANPESKYHTKEALVEKFGEERAKDIIDAEHYFRPTYNKAIDEANDVLKKIYPNDPTKLIPYRKDYFHHFRDFGDGFLDAIRNFMDVPSGIDPKLVGISEMTKPKQKFKAFAQLRKGPRAQRDAVEGYLRFMEGVEYLKAVEPHISRFRYLRRKIAEVAPRAGTEEDGMTMGGVDHFLYFLDMFSNDLSGKTSFFDRIQEVVLGGRSALKVIDFISNRIKANTMAGNAGTAIAQLANIPAVIAEAKQHTAAGFARTIAGIFDPGAASRESTFLRERTQKSYKAEFPINFSKHPFKRTEEEASKVFSWILHVGDKVGTEFAWNSFFEKYLSENRTMKDGQELWKQGSMDDAMKYADQHARRLVAGRGIGELPLAQKSKIMQAAMPFTIETNNLWYWLAERGREKDFTALATFVIANYLYNESMQKIRGSRVSYDPINAILEGSDTFMQEYNAGHYVQGAVKFAGRQAGEVISNVGGGQIATSMMMPDQVFGIKKQDLFGQGDPNRYGPPLLAAGILNDPVSKVLPPMAGVQFKKSWNGINALLDGQGTSRKTGKATFPIARTPQNIFRAALFGPYATTEAQNSFDSGDTLHTALSIQDREQATASLDAEATWRKFKDMPKDDRAGEWEKKVKTNPDLMKKVIQIAKDEKKGLDANDRLVMMLHVGNGARARYIVDQINSLKTKEEKQALWKDYATKKIITKDVATQVTELLKK